DADQLRREAAVVLQRHLDLARVLDDVRIGHHVAVLRVDDHARSGGDLRLLRLRRAEEAAEERVAQQRVLLFRALLQNGDVDHRRRHLLEDRREGRQAVASGYLSLHRESGEQEKQKLHSSDWLCSPGGRRSRTSVFIGTSLRRRSTSCLPYSK